MEHIRNIYIEASSYIPNMEQKVYDSKQDGTKVHIPSEQIKQYDDLRKRNLTGQSLAAFVRSAFDEKRTALLVNEGGSYAK